MAEYFMYVSIYVTKSTLQKNYSTSQLIRLKKFGALILPKKVWNLLGFFKQKKTHVNHMETKKLVGLPF
jgi:hypothetical protein